MQIVLPSRNKHTGHKFTHAKLIVALESAFGCRLMRISQDFPTGFRALLQSESKSNAFTIAFELNKYDKYVSERASRQVIGEDRIKQERFAKNSYIVTIDTDDSCTLKQAFNFAQQYDGQLSALNVVV